MRARIVYSKIMSVVNTISIIGQRALEFGSILTNLLSNNLISKPDSLCCIIVRSYSIVYEKYNYVLNILIEGDRLNIFDMTRVGTRICFFVYRFCFVFNIADTII